MAFGGFNNQQSGSASASELTVTNPTSLAVGDFMIAHYLTNVTGQTLTNATGFTTLQTIDDGNLMTRIAYKIATAGDVSGNSYTFSNTGGAAVCQLVLTRITGVNGTTPVPTSSQKVNTGSTTATANTCTPTTANSLILLFFSPGGTASISGWALATSSPAFTQAYDLQEEGATGTRCLSCAYGTRPETTATGNGTATWSTSRASYGFMVVVNPVSGPASVKTVNGLAKASVKTVNGLAIASVKTINGLA